MNQAARRLPVAEDASPFLPALANVEAEKGLLGVLLLDNRCLDSVGDFLRPHHFSVAAHARLFEAVTAVIEKGQVSGYSWRFPKLRGDPRHASWR